MHIETRRERRAVRLVVDPVFSTTQVTQLLAFKLVE